MPAQRSRARRCKASRRHRRWRPACPPVYLSTGGEPMSHAVSDATFAGQLPAFYQQYLVPLIFEPYAADLAQRLTRRPLRQVLEIAAGTGVVTRRLASALPESVVIVATDLNR